MKIVKLLNNKEPDNDSGENQKAADNFSRAGQFAGFRAGTAGDGCVVAVENIGHRFLSGQGSFLRRKMIIVCLPHKIR